MRIAVDTNVLVRAVVRDDPHQADAAIKLLSRAEKVAVAMPCLCEFVWVLLRVYSLSPKDVAEALLVLMHAANVETNRPALEAGLAILASGGDFADGVIAHEGGTLGGKTFVSFDKKAIALLAAQGIDARLIIGGQDIH